MSSIQFGLLGEKYNSWEDLMGHYTDYAEGLVVSGGQLNVSSPDGIKLNDQTITTWAGVRPYLNLDADYYTQGAVETMITGMQTAIQLEYDAKIANLQQQIDTIMNLFDE
jgi:hypothetical protein